MNSFNWLNYIDLFHKYTNSVNCSCQSGSFLSGSRLFGSFSLGSYQFGSYQFGSFVFGSYQFGSYQFGSFDWSSYSFGSCNRQLTFADCQLLYEPLNLFGYGIDLIWKNNWQLYIRYLRSLFSQKILRGTFRQTVLSFTQPRFHPSPAAETATSPLCTATTADWLIFNKKV